MVRQGGPVGRRAGRGRVRSLRARKLPHRPNAGRRGPGPARIAPRLVRGPRVDARVGPRVPGPHGWASSRVRPGRSGTGGRTDPRGGAGCDPGRLPTCGNPSRPGRYLLGLLPRRPDPRRRGQRRRHSVGPWRPVRAREACGPRGRLRRRLLAGRRDGGKRGRGRGGAPTAGPSPAGPVDLRARLWDVDTGALRIELPGHPGRVSAIAFSPDGGRVATGTGRPDLKVRVWNAVTGALERSIPGHADKIRALRFAPDARSLASGGADYSVRIWNLSGTGADSGSGPGR
jgi:WD domain, G-beta repeat